MPGMMDTILDVGMTVRSNGTLPGRVPPTSPTTPDGDSPACIGASSARPVPTTRMPSCARASGGVRLLELTSRRCLSRPSRPRRPGGAAVVVQAMVFGNLTANSGAGLLSRNPIAEPTNRSANGYPAAKGDDVVSGWSPSHRSPCATSSRRLRPTDGRRGLERMASDVQKSIHRGGRPAVAAADPAGGTLGAAIRATGAATASRGLIDDTRHCAQVTPTHRDCYGRRCRRKHGWLRFWPRACRLPGWYQDRLHRVDEALDAGPGRAGHLGARSPDRRTSWACLPRKACHRVGVPPVMRRWLAARSVAVVGCGPGVAALASKEITVDGYEGEVRQAFWHCCLVGK